MILEIKDITIWLPVGFFCISYPNYWYKYRFCSTAFVLKSPQLLIFGDRDITNVFIYFEN